MKLHKHLIADLLTALHSIMAEGRAADRVVAEALKSHPKWGSRDRRLFAESAYDLVRWWRRYWHLAGLPDSAFFDAECQTQDALWRLWAAYWIDRNQEAPLFPEAGQVTVESVAALTAQNPPRAVKASIPDWLDSLGSAEFGDRWPALLDELNAPADVFLRVNPLRTSIESLVERLTAEGIDVASVDGVTNALRMIGRRNISQSAAVREGWCEVQDLNSQRISPLLEVSPGMTVVDACAGAGGKALHLAALMENRGQIIACDVSARKLEELTVRAKRSGIEIINPRLLEGLDALADLNGQADRLLLDVPCSGLGVLRRNPDAKWKLHPGEIQRLVSLQREILTHYSAVAKAGGKLVYATCSILPDENERQISRFVEQSGGAWNLEEQHTFPPRPHGGDGFYAARLIRS